MAGGYTYVTLLLTLCGVWQAEKVLTDIWLTFWVERKFYGWSDVGYLVAFALLAVLQALLMLSATIAFAYSGIFASRNIHSRTLRSVMKAPMSFFETNPIGRIISRFSKDLSQTDRILPRSLQSVVELALGFLGTLSLVLYAVPWVTLTLIVLIPLIGYFLRMFRSAMRELKRLESIARSPLYAQVNESLAGLSTIRAYGLEKTFIQTQERLQDIANQPTYIKNCVDTWMCVRAEGSLAVFLAVVATVGLATKVDPSLLGLALSYALTLLALLNLMTRDLAELEARMNCIERLEYYATSLPQEPAADTSEDPTTKEPPPDWPSSGEIAFDRAVLRYRPDLPPVLDALTATVRGGERVGVVGRTGAGKSSLIVALFRLVELAGGSVRIDGVDLATLGLRYLRRAIAIIPQTPVLFDGTIRSNLDPTNSHTDADIWHALERCELKDFVAAQDGKLLAPVTEGGDNFSVGQRQLLCLARALLLHARILVIDEATASVDVETDRKIQRILRTDFPNCTVLAIAHRLHTLAGYDRVLVVDAGSVVEFDTPRRLLADPSSRFSAMAAEGGSAAAAALRSVLAADNDEDMA